MTDAALEHFSGCRNLRHLALDRTSITDAGLVHLAGNKQLETLYLAQTAITDAGLAHFRGNNDLNELWLGDSQVTDVGLAIFKNCRNLTTLWLGGTEVTDEGVANFRGCKNLLDISLMYTSVTDKGLAHFQDCKNLKNLWLGGIKLTDAGLAYFKDCSNLTEVYLDGTNVSDLGLAHLKNCQHLATLSLTKTSVSDTGLPHLQDCKNLKVLYLQETQITAAGIDRLKKALPACSIEWDGDVTEPRALAAPENSGFVPLFNGKDFDGWVLRLRRDDPRRGDPDYFGTWKVESGELSGRGPGNVLLTVRDDFDNFHLRAEASLNWTSNSGILFRLQPGGTESYEAEMSIHDDPRYPSKTGSLIGTRSSDRHVAENIVVADRWFTLEIVAEDNHIVIKVNGQVTADVRDEEREFTRGRLALVAGGHAGGTVRFRKIEIKELPSSVIP